MRRAVVTTLSVVAVGSVLLGPVSFVRAPGNGWKVVAWNDLGMHCMDSDYGVFSILPPYNNVHAQVIDANSKLVKSSSGVSVTYEATADPLGSTNTTSAGKTNFWTWSNVLYGGSSTPDVGLAGNSMPGAANTPQPMTFDTTVPEFAAYGIPITPYDDARHKRPYPMLNVVARDGTGRFLANATPVVPVSDEMDCRVCHGSGSGDAAKPVSGWVYDRDAVRDYRLNILRRHDDLQASDPKYASALAQAGYSSKGLYDTVKTLHTPILCARCHASNALPGTGYAGIEALTAATHAFHASVIDPLTGLSLDSTANRSSCYRCHPGSETRCLRGAMGAAVASDGSLEMQCQSCHGGMSAVGASSRVGWLDQPNCQACHTGTASKNNGQIRYTDAHEADGSLRIAVDATFATNADVPAAGFSLYRFSNGHGGMRCEACHGSTHAEYPAAHPNDNVQVTAFQNHVGMLVECDRCHDQYPDTVSGGPHGMHPIGQQWVDDHHDVVEHSGKKQCQPCHGTDYRGTVLSHAQGDRSLDFKGTTIAFARGTTVGCYACHVGPDDDSSSHNHRPTVQDATATCVDLPVTVDLVASDADHDALALRIVAQPAHGRVGLSGTTATYLPDPGFAGDDPFTFAAWDGSIDSALGTVTVTRRATWGSYGVGYPGTNGVVPTLALDANPILGTTVTLSVSNSLGADTIALLLASTESSSVTTRNGGVLLTELEVLVPYALPAAGADLDWDVDVDPTLLGVSAFVQVLEVDAGARFKISFSDGLRATLGS
jgi:hypothetical protein